MLIKRKNYQPVWYNAKAHQPDDARDVIGIVVKPVIVEKGGRPEMRRVPELVCYEGGGWYDDPNPRARVLYWTEMPEIPDL